MMTQDEHLEWAKKRALEHLDRGENAEAWTSMVIDLRNHPELKNHPGLEIGVMFLLLPGWIENKASLHRWIVGFR